MACRDVRRHVTQSHAHSQTHHAGGITALLLWPVLAIIGLYVFSSSFFLAKQSLPYVSNCDEATALLQDTLGLSAEEISLLKSDMVLSSGHGCWMDRRVDSMVILVIDALRFDFAQRHLPLSVGARLANNTNSQLLKFVADPPTVTMQRLKGLTTGGLPTFADISASFGGASIDDEDTWVQQLKSTLPSRRGTSSSRLAFVGDDTWVDLFPTQFDDCHPFPSFNTRDLDTVDNGCLDHLPRLLQGLRRDTHPEGYEVVIAHFLGVDHVGHTYGPHNQHMDQKLKQMDAALSTVLDLLDESISCHVTLILGDHGMTEDGNHGGGSEQEINAALFAHFSTACGDMGESMDIKGTEVGQHAERAFQSIQQIDLVPTISLLLGLPIPYGNLGGLVPSLIPPFKLATAPYMTAALALNAAQVWRYFTVYSNTANKLPSLDELRAILQDSVSTYKTALQYENGQDALAYREACGKFKTFLTEASELGHRMWTRFDTVGMAIGGSILFLALLLGGVSVWQLGRHPSTKVKPVLPDQSLDMVLTTVFMTFQCAILTFSNSYIKAEMGIVMFAQAAICIALCCRRLVQSRMPSQKTKIDWWLPLVIPICSRASEILVLGHGLDPSLRTYTVHNSAVFLSSLTILVIVRLRLYLGRITVSLFDLLTDLAVLFFLALAWWEKRSLDPSRNGYLMSRIIFGLLAIGVLLSVPRFLVIDYNGSIDQFVRDGMSTLIFKILLAIMAVTGPSAATSVVLFLMSSMALYKITSESERVTVSSPVVAALWRLLVRHAFFATNHACAFNRLQYSAAFVASSDFQFVIGGVSLFINTFGWELLGLMIVPTVERLTNRGIAWRWYCFYQLVESFGSCISVSLMRRHLMVWAIFAPRFVFSAIFLTLNVITQLIILSMPDTPYYIASRMEINDK